MLFPLLSASANAIEKKSVAPGTVWELERICFPDAARKHEHDGLPPAIDSIQTPFAFRRPMLGELHDK